MDQAVDMRGGPMTENNARGVTPSDRLLQAMTKTVVLPERSKVLGEQVCIRIRVISRRERNEIYGGLPTFKMTIEEMLEYVKGMGGPARADYQDQADAADEKLLVRAIVSPRIVVEEAAPSDGALPITVVWPDRGFLVTEILRFSGFLATPPEAAEALPASPAAPKEELSGDGFRPPAGTHPGDGGALAPPAVGAAGEVAG